MALSPYHIYNDIHMNPTNNAHLWTIVGIVAMFIVGGLTVIMPQIPPAYQAIAEAVLGILTYFAHNSAVVTAGATRPV